MWDVRLLQKFSNNFQSEFFFFYKKIGKVCIGKCEIVKHHLKINMSHKISLKCLDFQKI